MKRKTVLLGVLLLALCGSPCWAGQGAVTLDCQYTNYSETLVVGENEVATVKSYLDWSMNMGNPEQYAGAVVMVTRPGTTAAASIDAKLALHNFGFFGSSLSPMNFTVAGPASIQLQPWPDVHVDFWALFTIEVQPRPFTPDKATTIGPNAGSVNVVLETSTNLIHWTTATNGIVYTNSPAARFFRIKTEKTANP